MHPERISGEAQHQQTTVQFNPSMPFDEHGGYFFQRDTV
jgi:hypothetical protein